MKVLILAVHDWGGVGNLLAQSLRSVGVNAKFYVSKATPFCHPSICINLGQAREFAKSCDVIQFMHSEKFPLNVNISNKKLAVFHGGGKYRHNSKQISKKFNAIVGLSIIQTYDLFGLGAKYEKWLLPPIDTHIIKPVYETEGDKIIVGHYPSSPKGKGSETIHKIINNVKNEVPDFEYRYSYDKVPWKEQMKRISKVDVYIERMSLKQQGKKNKKLWYKTGVWGMTALEAAALGKVVVTNFLGHDKYKKEYGHCGLQVANSEKDMEQLLIQLLSKPKEDLLKLKEETRKWVEENHNLQAVGMRLRGMYEKL